MNWTILKSETEYAAALARLEEIFESERGGPTFEEAELLVILIDRYEEEHEEKFPDPEVGV